MKALEKIKGIESLNTTACCNCDNDFKDMKFLLKAFEVMREMALDNCDGSGPINLSEKKNEDALNEEFEKRMAEK